MIAMQDNPSFRLVIDGVPCQVEQLRRALHVCGTLYRLQVMREKGQLTEQVRKSLLDEAGSLASSALPAPLKMRIRAFHENGRTASVDHAVDLESEGGTCD